MPYDRGSMRLVAQAELCLEHVPCQILKNHTKEFLLFLLTRHKWKKVIRTMEKW